MEKKAYNLLKKYKKHLTMQQYRTIKGQIHKGDSQAAMVGLKRLLEAKRAERLKQNKNLFGCVN